MKLKGPIIITVAIVLFFAARLTLPVLLSRARQKPAPAQFDDSDLKVQRVELADEENGFFALQEAAARLHWPEGREREISDLLRLGETRQRAQDSQITDAQRKAFMRRYGVVEPARTSPSPAEVSKPSEGLTPEVLLESNRDVVMQFDRILAPARILVPEPKRHDEEYPYLAAWKQIATLVSIQAAVYQREGREAEAFDLALQLVSLGHRIEDSGGGTPHYLMGATVKTLGLNRIRQMTYSSQLPAERLLVVASRLGEYRANESALTNALKVEYRLEGVMVQDMAEGNSSAMSNVLSYFPTAETRILSVTKTKQLFAQTTRVGLESIGLFRGEMPLEKLPRMPTNSSPWRLMLQGNAVGQLAYRLCEFNVDSLLSRKCNENVAVAATQLTLALKSYQLQHGFLPDSLTALVPDFLASVPRDDFDGRPFRYLRDQKVIYSVGPNLVDDGGQERDEQKHALDLVFKLGF